MYKSDAGIDQSYYDVAVGRCQEHVHSRMTTRGQKYD